MRGYPISTTKKQRPESWLAFVVRHLGISAIANLLAKAFPKSKFVGYDNYAPNMDYANDLAKKKALRLLELVFASIMPSTHFDLIVVGAGSGGGQKHL